jgi:hypothetical protein
MAYLLQYIPTSLPSSCYYVLQCKGVDPNGHTNDGMQKTDQEMPGKQSRIAKELSKQEDRLSL